MRRVGVVLSVGLACAACWWAWTRGHGEAGVGIVACTLAFSFGRWVGRREAIAAAVAAIRRRGRTGSHIDIARRLGR